MRKFRIVYVSFIFMILLWNCKNQIDDEEYSFVEKYGNYKFENFYMTKVSVRGIDGKNNYVINYYQKLNDTNYIDYAILLDVETLKVDSILEYTNLQIPIDTCKIEKLLKEFLEYEVKYLYVNEFNNIYVNIDDFEKSDLIKINNSNSIDTSLFRRLRKIKGNWYKYF